GDRMLLFTDGITEASDSNEEEFGEGNITAFALANSACSAGELTSKLLAVVTGFCDSHFQDDATVLAIAAK
ncbi:MAG: SpoIIE family protein phosphatase, partial [Terracidiphilus sp.]